MAVASGRIAGRAFRGRCAARHARRGPRLLLVARGLLPARRRAACLAAGRPLLDRRRPRADGIRPDCGMRLRGLQLRATLRIPASYALAVAAVVLATAPLGVVLPAEGGAVGGGRFGPPGGGAEFAGLAGPFLVAADDLLGHRARP